jgi:hypothetical protein
MLPGLALLDASVTAAVLDAARIPSLPDQLASLDAEHANLYDGESAEELADVAPYVASLGAGSKLNKWFFESAWGQSAGILVVSPATLHELRSHVRRLLMVVEETGKMLYFRPYDPRVLRIFLPTCDAEQLQFMFGPVEAYYAEADDPAQALRFTLEDGSLITETLDLTKPPPRGRPKIEWKG